MRQFSVQKSSLKGVITAPPSKSHTLRAILFASLANGKSTIYNYLQSPDTTAMIESCRLFGASLNIFPTYLVINGTGGKIEHINLKSVIDAGNSGIVLRFCASVGALATTPFIVTGDHSICHQRRMQPLIDGLTQLGALAISMQGDGFAPLTIQGPITGGVACIDGEDSQHVSALLIAAAFANEPIEIKVNHPGEKPWVALTLDWFDRLGIPYENKDFTHYRIKGNSLYNGFEYHVPGDFSSAAFPIAAAIVTKSNLTIQNLDVSDVQGDKEIIPILQKMGGAIEIDTSTKSVRVFGENPLVGMPIDINNCIDAITILAVIACFAKGETLLYNGAVAKHKECNRIKSIAFELSKMGAKIQETEDGLRIQCSALYGAKVHSHQDHRMAMSLCVAGLTAEGTTHISSIECVAKTFATFHEDFKAIGAIIKETAVRDGK